MRLSRSQTDAVRMAREALHALSPVLACEAALQALLEHPLAAPDVLEEAGNRLGRGAHEKARKEAAQCRPTSPI